MKGVGGAELVDVISTFLSKKKEKKGRRERKERKGRQLRRIVKYYEKGKANLKLKKKKKSAWDS